MIGDALSLMETKTAGSRFQSLRFVLQNIFYIRYKSIYVWFLNCLQEGFNSRDPYKWRVQHCSLQPRERSSLVGQCMIIMG